ncbi:hypothetical protein HID58_024716, partial [Brassica napus]
ELMQFSTQESDIAAAANEALKRFRDESKKRYNGYKLAALLSPLLTRRTKSTFVVTPPANVTETLIKEIPVQYSGNERDDDTKFSNEADSPMKLFLKLSLSLGHL